MCIRILHVVGIMARGGTETLIMNLYHQMDPEKVQFDFVVHGDEKGEYEDQINSMGGRIFRVPRYQGKNHLAYVKWWKDFFQKHREYDVIHGHMRSTAAIYLKIAKKQNRITIAHSHNTGSRGGCVAKAVKSVYQYPLRYIADYFFACSMDAGIWLFGEKVCKSSRFRILNNAIDTERFAFDNSLREKKRLELGVDGEFVIGHVGNFAHQKNHSFIVDIFEEVCKKDKACTLVLIGGGDPKIQREIENKVKDSKLETKTRFLGSRADVNEYLNAFDLFLFPSLHEGLGIVAIEAQANGLPCVLSDVIPREVEVTNQVTFLPLSTSAGEWAKEILVHKNNGCQRESRQKEIIAAGYDIKEIANGLADFYMEIVNR